MNIKEEDEADQQDENPRASQFTKEINNEENETSHSFLDFIQRNDRYASPISLTFNKKPSFTTVPGGLCSWVTICCVIAYTIIRIEIVMHASHII